MSELLFELQSSPLLFEFQSLLQYRWETTAQWSVVSYLDSVYYLIKRRFSITSQSSELLEFYYTWNLYTLRMLLLLQFVTRHIRLLQWNRPHFILIFAMMALLGYANCLVWIGQVPSSYSTGLCTRRRGSYYTFMDVYGCSHTEESIDGGSESLKPSRNDFIQFLYILHRSSFEQRSNSEQLF